jgi:hypothetical protein
MVILRLLKTNTPDFVNVSGRKIPLFNPPAIVGQYIFPRCKLIPLNVATTIAWFSKKQQLHPEYPCT